MSKKIIVLLALILIVTLSCKKNKSLKTNTKESVTKKETIPFIGTYSRSFAMGKDVNAKVTYNIFQDSIQYEMAGPMALNYTLHKDKFIADQNKWIGKKGDTQYVIFVKNVTDTEITLLKKKAKSMDDAIAMKFPSDTARSKFSSWNVYTRH